MPHHCVAKVERALGDAGRPVKGSRIALLGVSYKPSVGDIRESPELKILTLLGADLRYHDPHVPTLPDYGLSSIPLEEALQDADLAPIVTAHPAPGSHRRSASDTRTVGDRRRNARPTARLARETRTQATPGSECSPLGCYAPNPVHDATVKGAYNILMARQRSSDLCPTYQPIPASQMASHETLMENVVWL